MSRIREWQTEQLLKQFREAEQLGHTMQPIEDARISRDHMGKRVRCSCGWVSNPSAIVTRVMVAAVAHVGLVLGDGEAHPVTDPAPRRRVSG